MNSGVCYRLAITVPLHILSVTLPIVLLLSQFTEATPASFDVLNPSRVGSPSSTEMFSGTVTNNTGLDLRATDLFFNFSGFDPEVVSLAQLLGIPDFPLNDGQTSNIVNLFSFTLGPNAAATTTYAVDAVLQDSFGNSSDLVTISVRVRAGPPSLCDIDGDSDVDRNDIEAIIAARNTPAGINDPRDVDRDGTITVNDARICTLSCTKPRCAS